MTMDVLNSNWTATASVANQLWPDTCAATLDGISSVAALAEHLAEAHDLTLDEAYEAIAWQLVPALTPSTQAAA